MPFWGIGMNAFTRRLEFSADRYSQKLGFGMNALTNRRLSRVFSALVLTEAWCLARSGATTYRDFQELFWVSCPWIDHLGILHILSLCVCVCVSVCVSICLSFSLSLFARD